ncbi:MAG: acyltransferase [Thermoleophilaceae bacterium]|nr:acyltransferase [Thermoleophilaceae bacterium]
MPARRPERVAYLDNLKLLLVAVIIAAHGAVAYGSLESAWPYQDVQETQLGGAADSVLATMVIPAALFAMGLFFLISGLVTPGSVSWKGPRKFARDRLVRLGVPLLVWTLVLWPGAIWLAHLAAGESRSFWWQVAHGDPFLDTGPMWFVEVLLIYSLAYAAWIRLRDRAPTRPEDATMSLRDNPLSGRTLVVLAVCISVATVLVRPVLPAASGQIGQSHLWQWPQFVALFGLGIVGAEREWFNPLPDRLRRSCGLAALASLLAFLFVAGMIAALGVDGDVIFDPGIHWPAVALAALEGPMAVGASVWLLGEAQLRLSTRPGPFGQAMVRSAYGAFLFQGIVLLGLMIALRPIGVPAEVKALTAATFGVVGSFALAWLLVSRTGIGRVI